MNASLRPRDAAALPQEIMNAFCEAISPADLAVQQRLALRERVLQRAIETTADGTMTLRASAAQWTECAPFIHVKALRRDAANGTQTVLIRMQPGGVMPRHQHSKDEEFIVLQGECHIGAHRLCAGDVHLASAGSWHEPVTTQTGVVVLLRGEYPAPVHRPGS